MAKQTDNNIIVDNDEAVFNFINPNSNDNLSTMNGLDLQFLIALINDYYIQLRENLGLNQNVTFGLELEYENSNNVRIENLLNSVIFFGDRWITKRDSTLDNGAEINSPILKDNRMCWEDLDTVCSIVSDNAEIGNHSGGHIHIGTQVLGSNRYAWLNLIRLWSAYENIIFRFAYGKFLTARQSLNEFARSISKTFRDDFEYLTAHSASLDEIIDYISHSKYQAINFNNVDKNHCNRIKTKNTIEFRCPNGTLDAAIWQNNVNLFVKLLEYVKSPRFNEMTVEGRHRINFNVYDDIKWYDEIFLDQALEFCDMIFTNNVDKVYFLRQYLKSWEINDKPNKYQKAKELTRKGMKKN